MSGAGNRSGKGRSVRPAYQSPADRVRQPHRGLFVSSYFIRYWLPVLGAPLASLILVLRDMASGPHDEPWWTCEPTQEELAARIGVRNRKTVMGLLRHPLASLFIRREPRGGRDPVSGRYQRMSDRFWVLMQDPLLPGHEAQAVVAEAELLLQPPPGFSQSESKTGTHSCEISSPPVSDARTLTCEQPVKSTDPEAGKRTAESGPFRGQQRGMHEENAMHNNTQALTGLLAHGVSEQVARDLVRRYGPARIARQLRYHPLRRGLENPAGALVRAIEQDWPAPGSRRPDPPPPGGFGGRREEATVSRRNEEEHGRALLEKFAALPETTREALLREARERARAQWPSREIPVPEALVRACLLEILKERVPFAEGEPATQACGLPSQRAIEAFVRWFERRSGVTVRGRSRSPETVKTRHVCWLALRLMPYRPSYPQIAKVFGVDHTTVLYGVRRAASDPALRALAESWADQFRRALEEVDDLLE